MDTAFTAAEGVTVRPRRSPTPFGRIAHRAGVALVAWRRGVDRQPSRERLAELHERRLEAARLREEAFRSAALTRLI